MSLPSQSQGRNQASIRSFFQPKQPTYAAPPSAPRPQAQVHQQQFQTPPPAAPPLPRQTTTANDPAVTKTPIAVPLQKPTHHPNITISPILPSHVPSLRRIVSRLLPVRYPDSFYAALSDPSSSGAFSRVLLWTDSPIHCDDSDTAPSTSPRRPPKPTVIGGIICRPERSYQPRPQSARDIISDALYIQSLVLNEPYRRLGLARALLDEICELARRDEKWHCRTVCAHVWIDNVEGMKWYTARGFDKVQPVVAEYYRQLMPNDAWIVRRDIKLSNGGVLDALEQQASRTPALVGITDVASPPLPSATAAAGPPRNVPSASVNPSSRPSPSPSPRLGLSYQNTRPETEWNDLPAEMSRNLTVPGSGASSGASSRSSSVMRKKRDRSYPAAAFGS
ncbi:uncharacterized protein BCR38DRAFT_426761 [Pseudomassariella vexata]|uniref:N-acetyltransferase domain-containing protein n=1 Tax=Pseudomassariella vexata TaxID=1141098 RepID=A0A1Y2E714_9PEZI|nr:uncharacterized protein BCR38DRAFT_426761 [Pseudomassariella vexata]ORY67341.1 hypothetical protein BCR38DRAFT_426761 [Pseudomassariella vexata]